MFSLNCLEAKSASLFSFEGMYVILIQMLCSIAISHAHRVYWSQIRQFMLPIFLIALMAEVLSDMINKCEFCSAAAWDLRPKYMAMVSLMLMENPCSGTANLLWALALSRIADQPFSDASVVITLVA